MINVGLVKQIVAEKLTDRNLDTIDDEGLDLLTIEVLGDINMQAPVTVYKSLDQVPEYYFGVFVVGLYCKTLTRQGLEEKKRHLKVSDGGITIDPPDVAGQLDKMKGDACKRYTEILKSIKKQDRVAKHGRSLKGRLITDFPFGSIAKRGDRDTTTTWERFWRDV